MGSLLGLDSKKGEKTNQKCYIPSNGKVFELCWDVEEAVFTFLHPVEWTNLEHFRNGVIIDDYRLWKEFFEKNIRKQVVPSFYDPKITSKTFLDQYEEGITYKKFVLLHFKSWRTFEKLWGEDKTKCGKEFTWKAFFLSPNKLRMPGSKSIIDDITLERNIVGPYIGKFSKNEVVTINGTLSGLGGVIMNHRFELNRIMKLYFKEEIEKQIRPKDVFSCSKADYERFYSGKVVKWEGKIRSYNPGNMNSNRNFLGVKIQNHDADFTFQKQLRKKYVTKNTEKLISKKLYKGDIIEFVGRLSRYRNMIQVIDMKLLRKGNEIILETLFYLFLFFVALVVFTMLIFIPQLLNSKREYLIIRLLYYVSLLPSFFYVFIFTSFLVFAFVRKWGTRTNTIFIIFNFLLNLGIFFVKKLNFLWYGVYSLLSVCVLLFILVHVKRKVQTWWKKKMLSVKHSKLVWDI